MPLTLIKKARLLAVSNLHALFDAGLKANNVETLRQSLRDLAEASEAINDQVAASVGRKAHINQQIADLTAAMKNTNEDIDLLLGDNDEANDKFALPLEQKLLRFESDLESFKAQLADEETMESELQNAATQVQSNYDDALSRLRKLEALDRTADAKDQATDALKTAAGLTGDGPDLDNVEARIRERSAVSDARFDRAVGGVSGSAEQAVAAAQAAARLAERRARLKGATA